MTEAVVKHIKKLYQLEKRRFGDLAMRRLKKNKKHCFKTLLQADKTVFFVLVMMKSSVYKILL